MRKELKVAIVFLFIAVVLFAIDSTFPYDTSKRWGHFAQWDVIEGTIRALAIVIGPLGLGYAWRGWFRDRRGFSRWRATISCASVSFLSFSWLVSMTNLLPWLIHGPKPWSDVLYVSFPQFIIQTAAQYSILGALLFSFFLPADSMFLLWAALNFLLLTRGIAPTPTI